MTESKSNSNRDQQSGDIFAYLVLKETDCRTEFLKCVQVYELSGIEEDFMIVAFNMFIQNMIRAQHTVILWACPNTKLYENAYRFGFRETQNTPILFVKNESYAKLKKKR